MTSTARLTSILILSVIACANLAQATAFKTFQNFPAQAGNPFSSPTGVALPNGRLLIWNGASVFLQKFPGADAFLEIATGYTGDPAFAALAPDGHTVLLGAGGFGGEPYLNDLYLFDANNPQDFTPGAVVRNAPHFTGTFLTQNLVLLEVGRTDFSGSELHVIDIASKSLARNTLVVAGMPQSPVAKDIVLDKPPFTYSGSIGVDRANGIVYVTASSFAPPPDQELRYFSIQDLVDAFNTSAMLDWTADGTLIGAPNQFYGGGVSGITQAGRLVSSGSGGVQLINPSLSNPVAATIVESYDPGGLGQFYSAIYNAATDDLILIESGGGVYGPVDSVGGLPATQPIGIVLLIGTILLLAARRKGWKHTA